MRWQLATWHPAERWALATESMISGHLSIQLVGDVGWIMAYPCSAAQWEHATANVKTKAAGYSASSVLGKTTLLESCHGLQLSSLCKCPQMRLGRDLKLDTLCRIFCDFFRAAK